MLPTFNLLKAAHDGYNIQFRFLHGSGIIQNESNKQNFIASKFFWIFNVNSRLIRIQAERVKNEPKMKEFKENLTRTELQTADLQFIHKANTADKKNLLPILLIKINK